MVDGISVHDLLELMVKARVRADDEEVDVMTHKLLLAAGLTAGVALGLGSVQANPAYDIWDFSEPTTTWFAAPGIRLAKRQPADATPVTRVAPVTREAPVVATTSPAPAPEQSTTVQSTTASTAPSSTERLQVAITSPARQENSIPSIFSFFQAPQRDSNGLESFYDPVTKVWINYDPERFNSESRQRVISIPREEIDFASSEPAGTIIVSTEERRLYYILGNGRALRYGVGVGRDGFSWAGVKSVTRKTEWPDWRPPAEMIERRPDLPRFMPGGIANPLGARALYLGSTLYRIHGSNEPGTIGQAVSSGCFRMTNDDVTDLYERSKVGAKVIVR